jgi:hypothetical protein
LVFEKKYYAKDTSVKEDEKIKINALLEQMEVTVFRYRLTSVRVAMSLDMNALMELWKYTVFAF